MPHVTFALGNPTTTRQALLAKAMHDLFATDEKPPIASVENTESEQQGGEGPNPCQGQDHAACRSRGKPHQRSLVANLSADAPRPSIRLRARRYPTQRRRFWPFRTSWFSDAPQRGSIVFPGPAVWCQSPGALWS